MCYCWVFTLHIWVFNYAWYLRIDKNYWLSRPWPGLTSDIPCVGVWQGWLPEEARPTQCGRLEEKVVHTEGENLGVLPQGELQSPSSYRYTLFLWYLPSILLSPLLPFLPTSSPFHPPPSPSSSSTPSLLSCFFLPLLLPPSSPLPCFPPPFFPPFPSSCSPSHCVTAKLWMVSVSLWQNLTSVHFILSSSPLTTSHSYLQEREELAEVDLRKLLELKPPDQAGNLEQQCSFQIVLAERCPTVSNSVLLL